MIARPFDVHLWDGRSPMDLNARRLEKLRKAIRGDRVDLMMITSETNVRYLSGFSGEASVLLVGKDRAILLSDGRFASQIAQECPGFEVHIRPVGQLLFDAVGEVLAKLGCRRVGYEPASLSMASFAKLKEKAP